MKLKKIKVPIIARVFIAMILGILLGLIAPAWIVRIFVTFNEFFGQFIGFLVPLIILALVTASIANTKQNAGRMLTITMVIVFLSTIFSGLFSYGIGETVLPFFVSKDTQLNLEPQQGGDFAPYFTIQLPPPLDVMSALVLALMLGLGIRSAKADALEKAIEQLQKVVMLSIEKALVPLLPIYIFGVFLYMSAAGEVLGLIGDFMLVILLVIAVQALWVVLLYVIAGILARRNPFKMMGTMLPAFLFAFATSSSAATIPITLENANKICNKESTVKFVVPLCANLHIPGLSVHVVLCAMALMMSVGQPIDIITFIAFIFMLSITCVAAPGIPGGAVAVLPVLASILNFSPEMQAVCLSLCIALDAPITAVNVLCDGAVSIMVDRMVPEDKQEKDTLL